MKSIREHLALPNPRFVCKAPSGLEEFEVPLANEAGQPASPQQLALLEQLAGPAFATLRPLYEAFDGLLLHHHGETAGLFVFPIEELAERNDEWRQWFTALDPSELYEFQRSGFAFATIVASGNYFVAHEGRIYYSGHDDGDDAVWGENVEAFFQRALSDPAGFLTEAGCYTRYSDGVTDDQLIPERFLHD